MQLPLVVVLLSLARPARATNVTDPLYDQIRPRYMYTDHALNSGSNTNEACGYSASRRYALKTDDRCVYSKNIDFMPAEGAPTSKNMVTAGPDECCAACASASLRIAR